MSKVEIAASLPSVAPRNDLVTDEGIKKLLDVIASIIAYEYIQVAKQNKEVFVDSRFRGNDNMGRNDTEGDLG